MNIERMGLGDEQRQTIDDNILGEIRHALPETSLEETMILRDQDDLKRDLADRIELNFLGEKDWLLLTVLKSFDQPTFEHSLKTYEIAKAKIERPLANGTILKDLIKSEGVSLETFYHACLFHDIGKISIPLEVLNDQIREDEWAEYFLDKLPKEEQREIFEKNGLDPEILDTETDNQVIIKKMKEVELRAVKYVPISYAFAAEILKKFQIQSVNTNQPLLEIIKKHEAESERILSSLGYKEAAKLAGDHHGYGQEKSSLLKDKPATITSLRASTITASIIHLADVHQALASQRSYKEKRPIITILSILIQEARQGNIDQHIGAEWIYDEYTKIDSETIDNIRNRKTQDLLPSQLDAQYRELITITEFLEEGNFKV